MDVLADLKLSFLILKAEVQLGEEDSEVLVGETEGDRFEAVKVPLGEAEGDPAAEVLLGEDEGEVPFGDE